MGGARSRVFGALATGRLRRLPRGGRNMTGTHRDNPSDPFVSSTRHHPRTGLRHLRVSIALGTAAALSVSMSLGASAEDSPPPRHDELVSVLPGMAGDDDESEPTEALRGTAQQLAAELGVEVDDAVAALEWSGMFAMERAVLLHQHPEIYAQAEVDLESRTGTLYTTRPLEDVGFQLSSDIGATIRLVGDAALSVEDVRRENDRIQTLLHEHEVPTELIAVDPVSGILRLRAMTDLSEDELAARLGVTSVKLERIDYVPIDEEDVAPLGGGRWDEDGVDDGPNCTVAFAIVRSTSDDRGFLSAGHCATAS